MKTIKLTQGKIALVDDSDYMHLNQWKWYADKGNHTFYACRMNYAGGNKKKVPMHRYLMDAKKGEMIDHKNGNGLDNQSINLRICTRSQNACNTTNNKKGTSRYFGASYSVSSGRWRAQIMANCKKKHLGYFDTDIEAAIIYNISARKYHGEFATLNSF